MKSLLPVLLICICALSHALATVEEDEALVAKDIEALHDEHEEVRAKAAAELRAIIARYPSGTSDLRNKDSGEAMWKARLVSIAPGMKKADVLRQMPPIQNTHTCLTVGIFDFENVTDDCRVDLHWVVALTWGSGMKPSESNGLPFTTFTAGQIIADTFRLPWRYWYTHRADRLDSHFQLAEWFNEVDRSLPKLGAGELKIPATLWAAPQLLHSELAVHVSIPKVYTGTWTQYYTNGQKLSEAEIKDGELNGAARDFMQDGSVWFSGYYDNGNLRWFK